jgi:hypothetical protein
MHAISLHRPEEYPPVPSSRVLTKEAEFYYRDLGLPCPVLVGRSSTTPWEEPTDSEEHQPKVVTLTGNHAISKACNEGDLHKKMMDHLDSNGVRWTRIDVARIGYEEDYGPFRPLIFWIGVMPGTLAFEDGNRVARSCLEILHQYDITDIEVEIRECVVTHWGSHAALLDMEKPVEPRTQPKSKKKEKIKARRARRQGTLYFPSMTP